jgi:Mrp family chromosome partitioning ATPase
LAEGGASVALVDTDPRSCRIAEYFGVDGSVGVTTVVSGATPLSAAAQRYNGRLFILPAGPAPAMVPQAASPTQLRELVDRLGQAADQIVVHVAPVLADARSAELCAAAGPVVLAVRANRTRQADLSLTAEILGGAKATLAAVVLATARLAPLPSAFQADGPLPKERPASSANGGGRAAPERTPSFHAAAAHQRNHGA